MCGIFGTIINKGSSIDSNDLKVVLKNLAIYSESRGKDSSGLAILNLPEKKIDVVKGNIRIKELLKDRVVAHKINNNFGDNNLIENSLLAFGHARLVTDGSQLKPFNNQPVIKDDIVLVHNGIIVNVNELWQNHPDLYREFQIDTEIINALFNKHLKENIGISNAIKKSLDQLKGTYSIAGFFAKYNAILLATNNGSLYYVTDYKNYFFFASEEYYLKKISKTSSFQTISGKTQIKQLGINERLWINLDGFSIVNLDEEIKKKKEYSIEVSEHLIESQSHKTEMVIDPSSFINTGKEAHLSKMLEFNVEAIRKLKRCTKCILPETFPFISFDKNSVCNYCNNYKKKEYPKNLDQLKKLVEPYRKSKGKPDCLVPFSGGRDSTYTLHVIKTELDLNPIAFNYDWGMVTDLARRNAARVCGKLGVENIIVAADIQSKRKNINQNITAWLKKPHLGMIPLFMAGDKYFFHYSNQILKQTGLQLSIWGSNPYENTDFKSGFAGIEPLFDKKRIDDIKFSNKLNLIRFFLNQYLSNTGYINSSIVDTVGSFYSRYMSKRHGYLQLFDYLKWNEQDVEDLIFKEYNWEKSIDSKSTWRIGDGTAAFYNYIYYTVAGFSEFDTFRSNQIRDGELTREQALKSVYEENFPRFENLSWYIEIIGLDFIKTIETINKIPKLYNAYL